MQASSGNCHLVLLDENGAIYCLGNGSRGELGQHQLVAHSDILMKVTVDLEEDEKMVDVFAGGWHNLVLSDKGNVYSWGANQKGQTGHDQDVS